MEDAHDAVSVLRRRAARIERDDRAGGGDTENQTSHLASLPFAVGCGSPKTSPEQLFSNRRRLQSLSKVCRALTGGVGSRDHAHAFEPPPATILPAGRSTSDERVSAREVEGVLCHLSGFGAAE